MVIINMPSDGNSLRILLVIRCFIVSKFVIAALMFPFGMDFQENYLWIKFEVEEHTPRKGFKTSPK